MNMAFERKQDGPGKMYVQIVYMNAVMRETDTRNRKARLFVSGVEFSRDMSRIVKSKKDVKTITFPSTVREVPDGAFSGTSVRSAVLDEGLEKLGEHHGHDSVGVFGRTPLSRVVLPSTLRTMGDCTFYMCEQLKRVIFADESRLEDIGKYCFFESGLEEIAIPSSVRTMDCYAFQQCHNLKKVTF